MTTKRIVRWVVTHPHWPEADGYYAVLAQDEQEAEQWEDDYHNYGQREPVQIHRIELDVKVPETEADAKKLARQAGLKIWIREDEEGWYVEPSSMMASVEELELWQALQRMAAGRDKAQRDADELGAGYASMQTRQENLEAERNKLAGENERLKEQLRQTVFGLPPTPDEYTEEHLGV